MWCKFMQSTKVINLCLKRVICKGTYLGIYLKVSLFKTTPKYTASAIIQKDVKNYVIMRLRSLKIEKWYQLVHKI